jgi:endonuclease YncB( thermonuclease family)
VTLTDRTENSIRRHVGPPQERRIPAFGLAAMAGWRDAFLIAAFAAGWALCGALPALAEDQASKPPGRLCGGDEIARGTVGKILDGRTFVLDDGREVRLAAIEVAPPVGTKDRTESAGRAAAAALDALAAGDQVVLRRAETGSDRYGRLVAYAYTLRDVEEFLLQRELLAEGLARVGSRIGHSCSSAMRKPPGRPNLAYGPIRIMRCSTPTVQRMHWRIAVDLRWLKAKWRPCAKAGPQFT